MRPVPVSPAPPWRITARSTTAGSTACATALAVDKDTGPTVVPPLNASTRWPDCGVVDVVVEGTVGSGEGGAGAVDGDVDTGAVVGASAGRDVVVALGAASGTRRGG